MVHTATEEEKYAKTGFHRFKNHPNTVRYCCKMTSLFENCSDYLHENSDVLFTQLIPSLFS